MTKIILSGCCGRMGKVITNEVAKLEDCKIVAGVDLVANESADFPIFKSFNDIDCDADVIIDFSNPALLDSLLDYVKKASIPVVIATTGYNTEQTETIKNAAKEAPIFFSFNMSLGVNLLIELSKKAACVLGDSFDIEIVESHHNQKLDAPSGTAVMIADGIQSVLDEEHELVYDRHQNRKKREKTEIGIHAIRGGTIVGEHSVIFAGHDEIITLSHSARSREIFAVGSIKAAIFMVGKPNGLYSMSNLIQ